MTLGFPPWRREALRTTAGPAWRRCSARWTSSKIYSRLALADAQQRYDQVITRSPSDPRRYLAAWATFGRTGPSPDSRSRMVNNRHQRTLSARPAVVGQLIDGLAGHEDRLWPTEQWPAMCLDRPLGVGARGGHGPVRYCVEAYTPGEAIRFRFEAPK